MFNVRWRAATHVWWRSVYVYKRTWIMNLLPNFFEPIIYLVGMGMGLGGYIGNSMGGGDYLAFLAPGLMMSNAMNGGCFETTYNLFVKMSFNRTYEAILATPVTAEDAMVGELLWASTRALLYGGVFAAVMALFGLLTPLGLLTLLPVAALCGWLFAAIGMLFTSFMNNIDAFSFFYTLFLMPMFMFSGIFFPLDRMPVWLQGVAWCTPLFHAVRLARACQNGHLHPTCGSDALWMLAAALGISVVAVRRMRGRLVK